MDFSDEEKVAAHKAAGNLSKESTKEPSESVMETMDIDLDAELSALCGDTSALGAGESDSEHKKIEVSDLLLAASGGAGQTAPSQPFRGQRLTTESSHLSQETLRDSFDGDGDERDSFDVNVELMDDVAAATERKDEDDDIDIDFEEEFRGMNTREVQGHAHEAEHMSSGMASKTQHQSSASPEPSAAQPLPFAEDHIDISLDDGSDGDVDLDLNGFQVVAAKVPLAAGNVDRHAGPAEKRKIARQEDTDSEPDVAPEPAEHTASKQQAALDRRAAALARGDMTGGLAEDDDDSDVENAFANAMSHPTASSSAAGQATVPKAQVPLVVGSSLHATPSPQVQAAVVSASDAVIGVATKNRAAETPPDEDGRDKKKEASDAAHVARCSWDAAMPAIHAEQRADSSQFAPAAEPLPDPEPEVEASPDRTLSSQAQPQDARKRAASRDGAFKDLKINLPQERKDAASRVAQQREPLLASASQPPQPPTRTAPAQAKPVVSLADLMGCAVASVEKIVEESPAPTKSVPAAQTKAANSTAVHNDAPSVATSSRPSAAQQKSAGQGQYFSRPDAMEAALKNPRPPVPPPAAAASVASSTAGSGAAAVNDGASLANLRKTYGDGPSSNSRLPVTSSGEGLDDVSAVEEEDLEGEWNTVAARTEDMRAMEKARGKIAPKDDPMVEPISYKEVGEWLKNMVVDQAVLRPLHDEKVEKVGCGCFGGARTKGDVPGLDKKLLKDKDVFLFVKMTEFDFNDVVHFRMLRTIYIKVTRNKICPSIGHHWAQIGFQGGDPKSDLNRSGGVLNVLHMFYYYCHYFELFKATYLLAQDHEQNFPMAALSINITRMVVDYFQRGVFSTLCNKNGDVVQMTCKIYAAGLHYFYKRWRTQKRTIMDTEKTIKEVQTLMLKPKDLLKELATGDEERKSKFDASRLEFTDMEFGAAKGKAPAPQGKAKAAAVPKRLQNYAGGADDD